MFNDCKFLQEMVIRQLEPALRPQVMLGNGMVSESSAVGQTIYAADSMQSMPLESFKSCFLTGGVIWDM